MSYRLAMPIAEVDQRFKLEDLEEALLSLAQRIRWWVGTRSSTEVDEEYADLGLYFWLARAGDEYIGNMLLTERAHAEKHLPSRALMIEYSGLQSLRAVEAALKTCDEQILAADVQHHLLASAGWELRA
ncbi:hypothetical protein [Rhizobium leguminosarum]|uniref:hypothetical protein n=1 Tax=Rhizobium leguminosarum TaxID=384 RepID=UPI001C93BD67|nr:hypothetical protein [Rhizobium leguminosarum]MBY5462074.1 hypothetical protein [Rhizobium leguminosarum]